MRQIIIAAAMITIAGIASACLAAAGTQAPDWSSAREVDVQLSSFKFTPSVLTLQHGVAYRIRLTNTSSGGHDFAARELFDASFIDSADKSKIHNGQVDVDGKETVEIRLLPMLAGRYQLKCTHFFHTTFGMVGTINVS